MLTTNQLFYFDNNATTKVDDQVLEAMLPYLKDNYGNPSSIYSFGKQVKNKIDKARQSVARLLQADSDEIIFTSCATESNNTAIFSAVRNQPEKKHLITTQVEHSSVLETMKYLETVGYQITYLSVDNKGRINIDELKDVIKKDTLLITVLYANNEIGNIYPIKLIGEIAKQNNILFHVDAVQAIGKTQIDLKSLPIDSLALSGHKIHAPKGIGAFYLRKNTPFTPLIFGGHQERGMRGGTENTPYIIGLGKAAELIIEDNYQSIKKIGILRDYLEERIKKQVENIEIYGDFDSRLLNTTSIAFDGIKGEELLLMLEANNIFVSTGSACNSYEVKPSHVLAACHVNLEKSSPIRISLGKYNTQEEVDFLITKLVNIVNTLRNR